MLYHLTAEAGRTYFDPRPYWHLNYIQSGRVRDRTSIPTGALIHEVFYASAMPKAVFYAVPRDIRRLYSTQEEHGGGFARAAATLGKTRAKRLMVFEETDRFAILDYAFSVYTFEPDEFEHLPSREYVAYHRVCPVSEERHWNGAAYITDNGFSVSYVDDIWKVKRALVRAGARFDAEHLRGDRPS